MDASVKYGSNPASFAYFNPFHKTMAKIVKYLTKNGKSKHFVLNRANQCKAASPQGAANKGQPKRKSGPSEAPKSPLEYLENHVEVPQNYVTCIRFPSGFM